MGDGVTTPFLRNASTQNTITVGATAPRATRVHSGRPSWNTIATAIETFEMACAWRWPRRT